MSLWDRHSEFPIITTSHSVSRGDLFCRHSQENHTAREAEEGALEVDIRWVGREEDQFQAHPAFHSQWVVFAL